MGIITVLLYSTGYLTGDFEVPHWVAISCYIAIGLGTLTGGWKIIETMGSRITKLSQHQGFAASTGGSIMVFTASLLGIPGIDDTHDHRMCHWRRRRPPSIGGALGRCPECDDRLGHHHSCFGSCRGAILLADHAFRLNPMRRCRPSSAGFH